MYNQAMHYFRIASWIALLACTAQPSLAVERVSFRHKDKSVHVDGQIVVEAADGGLLLQDAAGVLWDILPDEITKRESDPLPYEPLDQEEIGQQLLKDFASGFRIHRTAHYVICYNTSEAYAEWCGALYERLYLAFHTYWKNRGFELAEPQLPLVALVFDDKSSYASYAREELGDATSSIIGYYSLRTNRVIMYDLTGTEGAGLPVRGANATRINQLLSRPGAERTVATIIHEATHQLAFNCGLQTRYADIPLWVSEGVAIYFETPDLQSAKGWRNIGGVNRVRLAEFRQFQSRRPADSLVTLVSNDDRFRAARTAPEAYAEAWAWNYFLIRTRLKEYLAYMRQLSDKKPLRYDTPEERIAQFKQAFGDDLEKLDAEFLRYMRSVR